MNTEYLKEFVVLAETKNFWEASERLYMNQSTLSKHIKAMESELGVQLLNRTTRKVSLTQYGQVYLPYAQSISRADFEGLTAIRQLQSIENGLLSIGSLPSMPQYRITQLIAQFQERHPDSTVRIYEDDPVNLMHYLEDESCEIIITREDKQEFEYNYINDKRINRIPYLSDRLVALLPKKHPLAKEKSITLPQLKDEHFCFIKEGSLMYHITMDVCQQAGFVPNIIFSSHRIDSLIDMVTNQNCVALLMDQHILMPENGPRQVGIPWTAVPITPNIQTQISVCYRADKPLSKTGQLFVDLLTENLFGNTVNPGK